MSALADYLNTSVSYNRYFPAGLPVEKRIGKVIAIAYDNDLVVQDRQDREIVKIRKSEVARISNRYAVLGFDPTTQKFIVGDTKDSERYALNSFRKHFPNAKEVQKVVFDE